MTTIVNVTEKKMQKNLCPNDRNAPKEDTKEICFKR